MNMNMNMKLELTHSRLHEAAFTVVQFNDDLEDTVEQMIEIAVKEGGVGLAANQVGIPLQIIVVKSGQDWVSMINPVIYWHSLDRKRSHEGCLSFPSLSVKKSRWSRIKVNFNGTDGNKYSISLGGKMAIRVQHEIDHLRGITIND